MNLEQLQENLRENKSSPVRLIEDVVQIAKYLLWDSEIGKEKAWEIIKDIHNCKYGSKEGIWPQIEDAIKKIKSTDAQQTT